MNARRYPRTMEGAFGPYHRSSQCPIEPMPDQLHPADLIVVRASLAVLAVLVVIFTCEWIWL